MIHQDFLGAQEMLALAMVSIEQASQDGGKLPALQEEPPASMFASRPVATNPGFGRFRPCARQIGPLRL